jgi:hypothetical protein
MKHFITLFFLVFQVTAFSQEIKLSSGSQQANLIELYTSEGCSSCPPAEAWLNNLKDDPRLWKQVIPVAFHVDYWDYIGWKDTFAVPENTRRQAKYRQEGGIATVYTPEIINNGKEWRRWFGLRSIPASDEMPGQLDVSIDDGKVNAKFTSKDSNQKNWKLNVALLGFGFETKIKAGENAGESLAHDFVVIGQDSQNSSNGTWQMALPTSPHKANREGIAIWVSQIDTLKPIQTVGGWLN